MSFVRHLSGWLQARLLQCASRAGLLPSSRRGILFLAPHPLSSDNGDGFLQRVRAIDACFSHLPRWYVKITLRGKSSITAYQEGSFFIRLPFWHFPLLLAVAGLLIHNKILYIHSVYNCCRGTDTLLLYVPGVFRILDAHGAVPEELRYTKAPLPIRILLTCAERIGITRAHCLIAVTHKMAEHLQHKYPSSSRTHIVLPIFGFPEKTKNLPIPPNIAPLVQEETASKPGVIYAGGTQHWQQLPRMFQAIMHQNNLARYLVLTNTPPELPPGFAERMENNPHICLTKLPPEQVLNIYPYFQYGFILRETNTVNRVACPTKMIEYLEYGLIPIMLSPELGDFADMGLQYLSLEKFEQGTLFSKDAYEKAIAQNKLVLKKLQEKQQNGLTLLKNRVENYLHTTQQ